MLPLSMHLCLHAAGIAVVATSIVVVVPQETVVVSLPLPS
jgi:hypothetical protein